MSQEDERNSRAFAVELVTDPEERARREARNGLLQFDAVLEMVDHWLQPDRPFRLRPSTVLHLQRIALEGISAFAGVFRPAAIEISGSAHHPIGAHLVPEAVEEMCDYVDQHWNKATAIHLASYVMWRLNWIHPFMDGNGRTSRSTSYLVLCLKLGYKLPGTPTIPEQIAQNKQPYYEALEAADGSYRDRHAINVTAMEGLLSGLLATQLISVLKKAGVALAPD